MTSRFACSYTFPEQIAKHPLLLPQEMGNGMPGLLESRHAHMPDKILQFSVPCQTPPKPAFGGAPKLAVIMPAWTRCWNRGFPEISHFVMQYSQFFRCRRGSLLRELPGSSPECFGWWHEHAKIPMRRARADDRQSEN